MGHITCKSMGRVFGVVRRQFKTFRENKSRRNLNYPHST